MFERKSTYKIFLLAVALSIILSSAFVLSEILSNPTCLDNDKDGFFNPAPLSTVYRFWNDDANDHFYTINEAEKNKILTNYSSVYIDEGKAFYVYSSQVDGTLPVYRFWSAVGNVHFYTISEAEKNKLLINYSSFWNYYEGIAFYAYPTQVAGTLPVYRFWDNKTNGHVYTISEAEKNKLLINYSEVWTYEGIAFYAFPTINPPSCGELDCNDNDNTVHPGAVEICDGKDNDCDGKIDDEGACDIECYKNSDCGTDQWVGGDFCSDSRNLFASWKVFECKNPGTTSSSCESSILVKLKQDCGINTYDEEYICKDNSKYLKTTTHNNGCNDDAQCESSTSSQETFIETCSYKCEAGECIEPPKECTSDANCSADYSSDKYCMANSVYQNVHDFFCKDSKCNEKITMQLVQTCSNLCFNGICVQPVCQSNSDCGTDGFTGAKFCEDNNVRQYFQSFTCKFPGTISSSCSSSNVSKLVEPCQFGCTAGKCNMPQECSFDSECGTTFSEKICVGNDIYNKTKSPFCNSGTCESKTQNTFVKSCDYKCQDGKCIEEQEHNGDFIRKEQVESSCGDGICDKALGEDEFNCYEDCKASVSIGNLVDPQSNPVALSNNSSISEIENTYLVPIILVVLSIILVIVLIIILIARR